MAPFPGNSLVIRRCNVLFVLLASFGLDRACADWATACQAGLAGFSFFRTDLYDQWYNEDSVLELAQTGAYVVPEDISEYVGFVGLPVFASYVPVGQFKYFPQKFAEDECVILATGVNRAQINQDFGYPGCFETTVAFKLHYTVQEDGSGFAIHRTNIFYSDMFIKKLFNNALDADTARDFICDDVLLENCAETAALNNLTSDSCKLLYDALPSTNDGGYLDYNSKGCRIVHAAFAQINDKHCPHLSFEPQVDYMNRTKCQVSNEVKVEDLFTYQELAIIQESAVEFGHDPLTMYTTCPIDPPCELRLSN